MQHNSGQRRKSAQALQDPEDMVLLREKLNQIAFGLRHAQPQSPLYATAQGMGMSPHKQHTQQHGHFKMFPLMDRPSTPPSSPQPRDVLRKQLLLKNHHAMLDDPARRTSNDASAYDGMALDMMCVDTVEITNSDHHPQQRPSSPATAGLPAMDQLRIVSSFSVMNKCPEGFRKRKSVHMDMEEPEGCVDDPRLKKASSQVNVLEVWDAPCPELYGSCGSTSCCPPDHVMEDACPSPSGSRSPVFASSMEQQHGKLSACSY
ncbi:TPA: hypothetical protein N0F65_010913 [Lagenidium giganteum]|uniref:Uncharacterized protein n=1 Tax=Lagenidium giganteum TaxID=4803 RepID=A0AAV2Z0X5_9STRA|nr:TPA: hypothetical protein N0F65_010913 [Lagenidium giganteum]